MTPTWNRVGRAVMPIRGLVVKASIGTRTGLRLQVTLNATCS